MNRTLRLIEGNPGAGRDAPSEQRAPAAPVTPRPVSAQSVSPSGVDGDPLGSNTIPDFKPGERPLAFGTIVDQYRIERLLATGGTSRVYRATHHFMGHVVALKILNESYARRPDIVERFKKEAQALKQMHHENIVDIDNAGLTEGGKPYIAMEFIEGGSLRDRLDRGPRLSLMEALNILIAVTDGAEAAHRVGIVHRDLKPDNILCSEDGRVKIVDFGLARFADAKRTDAKGVFGTAAYIAPERLNGLPGDVRSDIYSLGLVAYELVAGKNPMLGSRGRPSQEEAAANQLSFTPPWLWNVPEELAKAVARAIDKKPSRRFGSMADLGEAFRVVRTGLLQAEEAAEQARAVVAADDARATAPNQTVDLPIAAEPKRAGDSPRNTKARLQSVLDDVLRGSLRIPLIVGAVVGVTVATMVYMYQRSHQRAASTATEQAAPSAATATAASGAALAGVRGRGTAVPEPARTPRPTAAPIPEPAEPTSKSNPTSPPPGTPQGIASTQPRSKAAGPALAPAPAAKKTATSKPIAPPFPATAPTPPRTPQRRSPTPKPATLDINKIPSGLAADDSRAEPLPVAPRAIQPPPPMNPGATQPPAVGPGATQPPPPDPPSSPPRSIQPISPQLPREAVDSLPNSTESVLDPDRRNHGSRYD